MYVHVRLFLCSNIFDARVSTFLCSCQYISMLKIFLMLMYLYFYARAHIILCSNRLCARISMFICFCPMFLCSNIFYARVLCNWFQRTCPYIFMLQHNLCLCPYVSMLVLLYFYAWNIVYAPILMFLCSRKFWNKKIQVIENRNSGHRIQKPYSSRTNSLNYCHRN